MNKNNKPKFDYDFALNIKDNFPEIWSKGKNKKADDSFSMWTRHRIGERSDSVLNWLSNYNDSLDYGDTNKLNVIIDVMKSGGVVPKGQLHMKKTINREINKMVKDRSGKTKKNGNDKSDFVSQRYDFLELNEFSEKSYDAYLEKVFEKTDEGFLKGRAIVTNIGVFPYMQSDGSIRRELRLPEEVFDEESLATLKLKPISNGHPDVMVDPLNVSDLQVGSLGDFIHTDAYHVSIPLVINGKDAIEEVMAGKRSLSMGYKTDIEEESGVWMGVPYDAIQTNIRYNHCAIVGKGRAGDAVKMRLDSDEWSFPHKLAYSVDTQKHFEGEVMKDIKLDGVEYKAEAPVIAAYHGEKVKVDNLEKEIVNFKKDHSKTMAERDTFKEKCDSLEKENNSLKENSITKEDMDEIFITKMKITKLAEQTGVELTKDMDDLDIQKEIIKSVFPNSSSKLDNADEIYINARFDVVEEELKNRADAKNNGYFNPDKRVLGDKKHDSAAAHKNFLVTKFNNNKGEI